jgi:hypothetical protein
MPEQTNNDAPGADRPSARPGQEPPPRTGEAARPPQDDRRGPPRWGPSGHLEQAAGGHAEEPEADGDPGRLLAGPAVDEDAPQDHQGRR